MPGKWDITSNEPTDIIMINDKTIKMMRYNLNRRVNGLPTETAKPSESAVPAFLAAETIFFRTYREHLLLVFRILWRFYRQLQVNAQAQMNDRNDLRAFFWRFFPAGNF